VVWIPFCEIVFSSHAWTEWPISVRVALELMLQVADVLTYPADTVEYWHFH